MKKRSSVAQLQRLKVILFQLYSDLFVNNGTAEYAEKMGALNHTVYLYSFNHFNPKSFGLFSLLVPFKGNLPYAELLLIIGGFFEKHENVL